VPFEASRFFAAHDLRKAPFGEIGDATASIPSACLNMLFTTHARISPLLPVRPAEVTDLFYLIDGPVFKLQSRNIESFRAKATGPLLVCREIQKSIWIGRTRVQSDD